LRRLGELPKKMVKNKSYLETLENVSTGRSQRPVDTPFTLMILALRKTCLLYSVLASVPEKKFEAALRTEPNKELSVAKVAKATRRELKPKPSTPKNASSNATPLVKLVQKSVTGIPR
jgi:hypothetical protein